MKKIFAYFILSVFGFSLMAQLPYQSVVSRVENESPLVEALRQQKEAKKMSVTAGSLLDDPEVEFGYLWGSPSGKGNRWDLGVMQSFDFPTAYKHKKRILQLTAESADVSFDQQMNALRVEVRSLCSDIVYNNALVALYGRCVANADTMVFVYERRYQTGDCNILDYNRVKMDAADAHNKLNLAVAERDMLLGELKALNGGKEIDLSNIDFESVVPSEEAFAQLVRSNPELQALEMQSAISESEINLSRTQNLPHFSAGFGSENEVGEAFRGVKVGVSLPLWSNRGQVRRAQAEKRMVEEQLNSERLRYENRMRGLYAKMKALQQNVQTLEETFNQYNSIALLKKGFDGGQVTLEEYLLGVEFYNDAEISILEAKKELEQTYIQILNR